MLTLRPFAPGDEKVILRWIDSETTFYRWSAGRYGQYPMDASVLADAYASAGVEGPYPLVMTEDGVPVGHLLVRYPGEDRGIVRFGFVIVDGSRRGQGLGKRMLRLAVAFAREQLHARRVTIGVFEDNAPARACYRAIGFEELPEREQYELCGTTWSCVEMAMTLA